MALSPAANVSVSSLPAWARNAAAHGLAGTSSSAAAAASPAASPAATANTAASPATSANTAANGGINSFLQNGQIPEGSAVTNMTNETHLPDWFVNHAMSVIANQNAVADTPYQTYQGPRVAGFNQDQRQSFNLTDNAAKAYQPGMAAAMNLTGNAMHGQGALQAAAPGLNTAQNLTQDAVQSPGGVQYAQPWMARAGASSVDHIGQYMSPYTQSVVNQIGDLGTRNLTENIMPALQSKYISAGQLGFNRNGAATPTGMMTDTARAVRDTNNDILAQQSQALQQGYTQALNTAGTDLSRYQGIGGTMGQLAQGQIGQQLQGAGQMAEIAGQRGQLANQQQQTQLQGGAQMADLGGLQQKYGLTGADALNKIGNQQQQQTQQNLDTAYQDFLRQQGWSQQQIDAQVKTMQGLQGAVPTATTQQGVSPSGVPAQYSPSTASTIAGAGLGLASLLKGFGIF